MIGKLINKQVHLIGLTIGLTIGPSVGTATESAPPRLDEPKPKMFLSRFLPGLGGRLDGALAQMRLLFRRAGRVSAMRHPPAMREMEESFLDSVISGHLEVVRLLLEFGVDPNLRESDRMATPALHLAILSGHIPIARQLLLSGADPNSTDALGRTALMEAVAISNLRAIRLLLAAGARLDAADALGFTAPLIARYRHNTEALAALGAIS